MTSADVIPALRYRDARAAIEFLTGVLGFEAGEVTEDEEGRVAHAELRFGSGMVMLGSAGAGDDRFDRSIGASTVYVILEDAAGHHERARDGGAEIVRPLAETPYGSQEYTLRDPEGNLWCFGTYRPG
jgi:uncharacterized glyoxalase superfamily protein PhnB